MNSPTECRAVILHNEKEEESMNSPTECRAVTLYNAHNNNNNNSNNNKRKGLNSTTKCKAVTLYNFDGRAPIYLSDNHHLKSLHSFPIAVFFCKYPSVQNITFSQLKKKEDNKNTKSGQHSFSYPAPTTWSQLPVSVHQATFVNYFKYSLKTFCLFLFLHTTSLVLLP